MKSVSLFHLIFFFQLLYTPVC